MSHFGVKRFDTTRLGRVKVNEMLYCIIIITIIKITSNSISGSKYIGAEVSGAARC